MTAAAALPSPAAAVAADGGATLLERQLAMLAELAEIAMEVARAVGRQAAESEAGAGGADLTLAFSRAARAVRLTLLLQTRLVEGPSARAGTRGAAPVSREARMARARAHIERFVREEHGGDEQAVERLMAEGAERLAEEEDFDEMTMSQVVGLICNDLQLPAPLVTRALALFDEDDEHLPPPSYDPARPLELLWIGAPPRPRASPPPDPEEDGTGPPAPHARA
jgi:hypothetical protein